MLKNNCIFYVVSCIGSIFRAEEMLSFPNVKTLQVKYYECEKSRNDMLYRIINALIVHDVSIYESPRVTLPDFI